MSSFAWVVGKVVGGPNEDAATAMVSASNSSAGRFVARSLACAPVVLIYCTVLHFTFITSLPHFARNPWSLTASYNPFRSTPPRHQYAVGIERDQRFTSNHSHNGLPTWLETKYWTMTDSNHRRLTTNSCPTRPT